MLTLQETKSVLTRYNIRPNKRLSQSFLIDKNVQKKIIDEAGISDRDIVLEIGPGLGALTEELCNRAKRVIAVEKDRRLYDFLTETLHYQNLELIRGDILEYNFSIHNQLKVIGNIPYCISTNVIEKLLENRYFIDTAFITVQKEFARRITASPGDKTYGSISCFAQFYSTPEIIFSIKRHSFYPVPDVDSCFLKIQLKRDTPSLTDETKLFKIIRIAFRNRRKTILKSLYSSEVFGDKEDVLKKLGEAGIAPTRRPETISLSEFEKLAEVL